ncbi:hypothetical protein HZA87_01140 [Candidatus Uhrbacteria bacterium]|nr:hypothetical protein [Candidatus Uhrbacteria bacterium]
MTLEFVLTFLGWTFALVPLTVFLGVSINMVRGAGENDELILALSLIGLTFFLIGVIMLLLIYLTDFI